MCRSFLRACVRTDSLATVSSGSLLRPKKATVGIDPGPARQVTRRPPALHRRCCCCSSSCWAGGAACVTLLLVQACCLAAQGAGRACCCLAAARAWQRTAQQGQQGSELAGASGGLNAAGFHHSQRAANAARGLLSAWPTR